MNHFGILTYLIVVFFTGFTVTSAQNSNELKNKIQQNQKLFETQPDVALLEINTLIKEAERLGKDSLELRLLATQAEYYYFLNTDFEEMLNSAAVLEKKSKQYNNFLYEARAHKYRAQAFLFNELYDRALDELRVGLKILEDSKSEAPYVILEKANLHTALGNVYNLKGEHYSGFQSLLNSVKEHNKLENPEWRRGTKFMDYANLGSAYLKVNLDSAEYYAQKSLALKTEKEENHNQTYLNYIVLGNVRLEKGEYTDALSFYKKAESIKENKHFINTKELYEKMILLYEKMDSPKIASIYKEKLNELDFEISQNQNKSLRKIIKENQPEKKTDTLWMWLIAGCIAILALLGYLYWRYASKNNEKSTRPSILSTEKYNELIGLLKNNDPTFILAFENEYPDFSSKLQKQAPELTNQEIELLSMVKLNLSNKEIAQYKFIQHKTVQNRRYMIRKKLNLSSETDLNKWIENI
ncbi:MAG: LuxR family transcriptional regulator [Weeksellaceae bacterium]